MYGSIGRTLAAMYALAVMLSLGVPSCAGASAAPDGRSYELVSRFVEAGQPAGLNGVEPLFQAASVNGEAVDWEAIGGCCGASGGALNLYQSDRLGDGWQTQALTPPPNAPIEEVFNQQTPAYWNSELSQVVFSTPMSFAPGDARPRESGADDLYLRGPTGALTWLSQGPNGSGTGPYLASFEGATPNADEVAFTSPEPLTASAKALASLGTPAQYLYVRDVPHEETTLIDVGNNGELIDPYGASLGDGAPGSVSHLETSYRGSTTHALSADGSKAFFETPPEMPGLPEGIEPHLYMRDLSDATTTSIDDPNSPGWARYEGASTNGALVFFTSDEELDGASTATELYEFNTTNAAIGSVPQMTAVPLAGGSGVLGTVAISNDGSHVFFVASGVLAGNENSVGRSAAADRPNLYVRDTATGQISFIATLAPNDVSHCRPDCADNAPAGLISAVDLFRPAVPTPDGSVLVFSSSAELTGQAHVPATTLEAEAEPGQHTIVVASTAGFIAGHEVAIDIGEKEEIQTVATIDNPTEMTLSAYSGALSNGLATRHEAGATVTALSAEVYRYAATDDSLSCISCTPAGVAATASAALGEADGGSYAPDNHRTPMSEDGSRIFFASPDPLLAGMPEADTALPLEPTNVYEWENGQISLIAEGAAARAELDGTTPSGDDVFFTAHAQFASGDVPGYQDIYDARVGGGFPQAPQMPQPCFAEACRALLAPTTFFPNPASVNLGEAGEAQPHRAGRFRVTHITPAQRAALGRTGHLALTASATEPGRLTLRAFIRVHGRSEQVARTSAELPKPGSVTLRLHLGSSARTALADGKTLRLEVSYSASSGVRIAELSLLRTGKSTAKAKHSRHA